MYNNSLLKVCLKSDTLSSKYLNLINKQNLNTGHVQKTINFYKNQFNLNSMNMSMINFKVPKNYFKY